MLKPIVKLMSDIVTIKGDAEAMRGNVHDALLHCAGYIIKDGNTTPANALLSACQKTRIDGNALTRWLETFAPCYVKDGKLLHSSKRAKEHFPCVDDKDLEAYTVEMRKVTWYDLTPPVVIKSIFDPVSYLERVIKKLEKEGVPAETIQFVRSAESAEVQRVAALEKMAA
jgi:hypothetical protein